MHPVLWILLAWEDICTCKTVCGMEKSGHQVAYGQALFKLSPLPTGPQK